MTTTKSNGFKVSRATAVLIQVRFVNLFATIVNQ